MVWIAADMQALCKSSLECDTQLHLLLDDCAQPRQSCPLIATLLSIPPSFCATLSVRCQIPVMQQPQHDQIQYMRRQLTGEPREGIDVLIIDDICAALLQIVGAAVDFDPTFLWRHCNEKLESDVCVSELATLRSKFPSLVSGKRNPQSGPSGDVDQRAQRWAQCNPWYFEVIIVVVHG